MIYQQYTTAIKDAYAGNPNIAQEVDAARACRHWIESLAINPKLRNPLVEQILAIEEAFLDLAAKDSVS